MMAADDIKHVGNNHTPNEQADVAINVKKAYILCCIAKEITFRYAVWLKKCLGTLVFLLYGILTLNTTPKVLLRRSKNGEFHFSIRTEWFLKLYVDIYLPESSKLLSLSSESGYSLQMDGTFDRKSTTKGSNSETKDFHQQQPRENHIHESNIKQISKIVIDQNIQLSINSSPVPASPTVHHGFQQQSRNDSETKDSPNTETETSNATKNSIASESNKNNYLEKLTNQDFDIENNSFVNVKGHVTIKTDYNLCNGNNTLTPTQQYHDMTLYNHVSSFSYCFDQFVERSNVPLELVGLLPDTDLKHVTKRLKNCGYWIDLAGSTNRDDKQDLVSSDESLTAQCVVYKNCDFYFGPSVKLEYILSYFSKYDIDKIAIIFDLKVAAKDKSTSTDNKSAKCQAIYKDSPFESEEQYSLAEEKAETLHATVRVSRRRMKNSIPRRYNTSNTYMYSFKTGLRSHNIYTDDEIRMLMNVFFVSKQYVPRPSILWRTMHPLIEDTERFLDKHIK